jgi:hypothetical protein
MLEEISKIKNVCLGGGGGGGVKIIFGCWVIVYYDHLIKIQRKVDSI